jgi:hypothetical protein
MIRRHFAWLVGLVVIIVASFAAAPASAQPQWEKLGERTVNGRSDTDTIMVGASKGIYTHLQVKVEASALKMYDMKVHFGNGTVYDVPTAFIFDRNTSTRVIDLPGDKRVVSKVVFKYGNLPGGGNARVELWGRDVSNAAPPPPPSTGTWKKLGERTVNGSVDKDVIQVGSDDGTFTAAQIKVEGSTLKLYDMKIYFGDGSVQDLVNSPVYFDKDTRSRVIDLPGNRRVIKRVEFRYGNLPGGGNARVELWGKG